jgi:hypothetical protein
MRLEVRGMASASQTFVQLWGMYVSGFKSEKHCIYCLKGRKARRRAYAPCLVPRVRAATLWPPLGKWTVALTRNRWSTLFSRVTHFVCAAGFKRDRKGVGVREPGTIDQCRPEASDTNSAFPESNARVDDAVTPLQEKIAS